MRKFITHDGHKISLDVDPADSELVSLLNDIVPRLSLDEILDGELENRLKSTEFGSVKLSSADDVKQLIFSLAMLNTISKPPGF